MLALSHLYNLLSCFAVVASSDLSGLCELLVDMAGDWELLLSAIGVGSDKRRQLRLQHQDPKLCLVEGLEQWLVTTDTPTYGTIIGALRGKTAPNLPLAALVEEFASKKSSSPVGIYTINFSRVSVSKSASTVCMQFSLSLVSLSLKPLNRVALPHHLTHQVRRLIHVQTPPQLAHSTDNKQ